MTLTFYIQFLVWIFIIVFQIKLQRSFLFLDTIQLYSKTNPFFISFEVKMNFQFPCCHISLFFVKKTTTK